MKYLIYKITNLVNRKYYIGKHQTKDLNDGYMGSGKLLKIAIKKYGIENFKKEILHIFDNEEDMNNAEKELVVISEETYNLCEGGRVGFSYINRTRNHHEHNQKIADKRDYSKTDTSYVTTEWIEEKRVSAKQHWKNGTYTFIPDTTGMKHTDDVKKRMSEAHSGSKNSQYGTCWVTDGSNSKKIKNEELKEYLDNGFVKGRRIKRP
jgi:hypothetical protein